MGDETSAALMVRSRDTLAKLERAAGRPSNSTERKDRLSDLIGQQTDLIRRMEKALRLRRANPGTPT